MVIRVDRFGRSMREPAEGKFFPGLTDESEAEFWEAD
jgi:hypothetical protein